MKHYVGPVALSTPIESAVVGFDTDAIKEELYAAMQAGAGMEVPKERVLFINLNMGCYVMIDLLYVLLALDKE